LYRRLSVDSGTRNTESCASLVQCCAIKELYCCIIVIRCCRFTKCKCGKVYTRGRTLKTYSTKCLLDHLHRAHPAEYAQVKQKASKPVETRSNSTIRVLSDKPGSSTEKQPTLTDLVESQQPFGANHPMQRKLSHLVLEDWNG